MISDALAKELDAALESGKEFGFALLPGSDEPHWFGCGHDNGNISMDISPWLGRFEQRIRIGATGSEHLMAAPKCSRNQRSTPYNEYIEGVANVIESCNRRNGKTVYSRVITTGRPNKSYGQIAVELFKHHPSTLRFVYNTNLTGAWLGATPELLFDYKYNDNSFHSMAFAGTRLKQDEFEPWDEKNIQENRFVVEHINEVLNRYGSNISISALESVAYGKIEHLCAKIKALVPQQNLAELIDALNPTPALCGRPLDDALNDISMFEHHTRGCYGGFIGFSTPMGYKAYVNLRSMQFDADGCCIFGGGGITAQSDPKSEWEETEAKTELLRQLITTN